MNLWSDGYEDVAERIIVKQRQTGEPYQVHVADDGGVYTSPARKLPTHGPALELIGVYNGAARVEHVEDDLLAWMREQTKQHAA